MSMSTNVGTFSSSRKPPYAPVALPGLMKNFEPIWNASKRCVWPVTSMSTSSCRCSMASDALSPCGTTWWPCMTPTRNWPMVTTFCSGYVVTSSKSPFTTCTSLASDLKYWYSAAVHRLPVEITCCILPGTSSFLNAAGSAWCRCGMCRSPITSTSGIVGRRAAAARGGWPLKKILELSLLAGVEFLAHGRSVRRRYYQVGD
mmetsp:Transcript_40456/g.99341  ORF Transcript_40456/g.99341 Transcript_40456/m.99341 type:complete len:202 (-) Transcript_40456:4-609(-)